MPSTTTNPQTYVIGGDLEVRRLGFGAMRITGDGVWGPPADRARAIAVVKRAVELGVQLIDTADSYGPNVSEELIAEALLPYPEGLVIATKAGLTRSGPHEWHPKADPEYIKRCCDGSRERLGLHRIDLYQLHAPDPAVPYEESIRAFEELREDGFVRHIGLSNVTVDHIRRALEIVPVATVQNRYSLDDRVCEDVLDFCEANDIGFIPWYPLSAGALASECGAWAEVAGELGATTSQVALAWLLARSPVMLPIPGTSSIEHLEENLGSDSIELNEEQFERIDRASLAS
jgi:aryl-alcohol dehydrogenase-like predicted oxidoreductase